MLVSISDNVNSIEIIVTPSGSTSGNVPFYIDKPFSVITTSEYITIKNANFGSFSFCYSEMVTPTSSSISNLASILAGYLNTAIS